MIAVRFFGGGSTTPTPLFLVSPRNDPITAQIAVRPPDTPRLVPMPADLLSAILEGSPLDLDAFMTPTERPNR
jgi:hypothetical protein